MNSSIYPVLLLKQNIHVTISNGKGRFGLENFKQKEGRFRLEIRKTFFTIGMVRPWIKLSREIVDASSMKMFKVSLN